MPFLQLPGKNGFSQDRRYLPRAGSSFTLPRLFIRFLLTVQQAVRHTAVVTVHGGPQRPSSPLASAAPTSVSCSAAAFSPFYSRPHRKRSCLKGAETADDYRNFEAGQCMLCQAISAPAAASRTPLASHRLCQFRAGGEGARLFPSGIIKQNLVSMAAAMRKVSLTCFSSMAATCIWRLGGAQSGLPAPETGSAS